MSDKKYFLEEIKELHNNLKELQTEFQKKFVTLEGRLNTLISRINNECVEAPLCNESIHASDAIITAKQEVREPKEIRSTQSIQEHEEHKQPPAYISNAVELDEDRQTRKGIVKIALQALFFSFFPMILAPFLSLYTRIKEIIAHYRRQGKLAVFFMTLAGIIALVLGVGYILQYSFIHLLRPISKLSLCFVGSLMICALGILYILSFCSRSLNPSCSTPHTMAASGPYIFPDYRSHNRIYCLQNSVCS